MNRLLPLLAALALLNITLSGCTKDCYGEICNCNDDHADDVVLQFAPDTTGAQAPGFRQAELRGTYVVRYTKPGFAKPLDSVAYQRPGVVSTTGTYQRSVFLNRLFAARTGALNEFAQYNYAVVVPQAARRYQVADLEVNGERQGDKCCRCYVNIHKRLRLDGKVLTGDGQVAVPGAVLVR